jgi:hypothetical protein
MQTYSRDLLLPYKHSLAIPRDGVSYLYEPSDTEQLYKANLERQPADWYYRHNPVTYTWNSNGYRAPEWNDIDWPCTWIVMGCSLVVGIGVAEHHTLNSELSVLLGKPCVNLGMGGSGVDVIMYNSLRLIDHMIKPAGVVVVAPQLSRMTYWTSKHYENLVANFTQSAIDPYIQQAYEGHLRYEPNAEMHGHMKLRGIQALWRAEGVPVIMTHYNEGKAVKPIGLSLPDRQDAARDVGQVEGTPTGHNGFKTLSSWSTAIANSI